MLRQIQRKTFSNFSTFDWSTGNNDKVVEYSSALDARIAAVEQILWDEDVGVWLDFDLETGEGKNQFSAANVAPLWARCFVEDPEGGVTDFESRSLEYLKVRL